MRRCVACMVALLLAGVAGLGQSPLPMPSAQPGLPSPEPLPPLPPVPPGASGELRRELDRLKHAREELKRERDKFGKNGPVVPIDETGRIRLQMRLAELVRQFEDRSRRSPATVIDKPIPWPRPASARREGRPTPPTPPAPRDPATLARLQFQAGQVDKALGTLRGIKTVGMPARDRMWVQYLTACCLRKQGKVAEAAAIYREVAENRLDPFLADSAVWHLGFLRWRNEIEAGLAQSRRQVP